MSNKIRLAAISAAVSAPLMLVASNVHAADLTLADMFSTSDINDKAVSVVASAGPYLLVVFGITIVVGIGVALLGKTKKAIVNYFK
jgi:Na+-driven multidrug efflux pump